MYKLENKPLLARFQAAASLEPGKVKGLFCSITVDSLERVAALGLEPPEADSSSALFRREPVGLQIVAPPTMIMQFLTVLLKMDMEKLVFIIIDCPRRCDHI